MSILNKLGHKIVRLEEGDFIFDQLLNSNHGCLYKSPHVCARLVP